MDIVQTHTITVNDSVHLALTKLNTLASDAILFVVDEDNKLVGSLTDGDLRRGFIRNLGFEDSLLEFIQKDPVFIVPDQYTVDQIADYKARNFKIIPILNEKGIITDILNFRIQETIIPADAVLMAGGKGKRLMPLTADIPKPLLKVGEKPIIEHNIDRLVKYGIKDIRISINYLGQQLIDYFGDGRNKNARIDYIMENNPLGTIGSIILADNFKYDDILVMNADLLTDIDYADFYKVFKASGADMAVAATSYHVDVPYAVLEVDRNNIATSIKEKPRYTYYSNAGIYYVKKSILSMIPKEGPYDITDLMENLLVKGMKLITYPVTGYWLDIGRHEDYRQAQQDIKHLKL